MKKIYFLLLAFFLLTGVNAQIINFTDVNFKNKLLEADIINTIAKDLNGDFFKIDANNDNEIQITEAENISWLDLNFSAITDLSGINSFSNLEYLDFSRNNILNTDISGLKKLKRLFLADTLIETLNLSQLINLEELHSSSGKLTSINLSGLKMLTHLNLSFNSLKELDLSGLTNLKVIDCYENYDLQSLDLKGLIELEELTCRNSQLKFLYNLSDCKKLKKLSCENNLLNNLYLQGCTNLTTLICRNNNISNLNFSEMPKLTHVDAGSKNLTSIEVNGTTNIVQLLLDYSNIVTLDLSNFIKLEIAFCNRCESLTTIYCKNGLVEWLALNSCRSLKYICADEEQYKVLSDEINQNQLVGVNYNSYCSFTPGGTFYTLKGKTILDSNNNGCDTSDLSYSNLNFSITDGTNKGNIISNSTGDYNIPVGEGTHTITPILENPSYFTISPSSINVTFPAQASPFTQDFCITPNGNHQDVEVTILPIIPARPGFDATYKIIYKNKGNTILSGAVSLTFNDAVLDYVSAIPVISGQVTDKLTWDYTNLKPYESREITVTLNVNSPMETPAINIDDRLSFNALINPVTGDEKAVDNSSALRQKVVGSYDPNDKTCLEGDVITPSLIGEYVNYLIRFENTGTYPAQNIVVKDLIDLTKFDISTLVPTKASHEFVTKISEGNKVEFIFENINLPFDNATNDGYIAFKIKTLPTLVVGDSFANEANIYFDYNFPILTNKATSTFKTLGTSDFEFSNYFSVYPNPVNDILNIGLKNSIEVQSMAVYDILGQLVIAVPNAQTISKIDVSKLTTGNYFIKMNTDKGTSSVKFIKN
jgi:hypothetical protein